MTPIKLPTFTDHRGLLTICDRALPFEVKRAFWISNVPEGQTRASHGHRECQQAIFAIQGTFLVNGYCLHISNIGLYIPVNAIIKLHHFSENAIALVLCSEHYNESEVFRPETK